jgi:uncharacterized protein (DUF433 family)
MQYGKISIDPEIMSGTPVFVGTRVPIKNLFYYKEGGESLSEFLEDFPSVSKVIAIEILEMGKHFLTSEKILHESFA